MIAKKIRRLAIANRGEVAVRIIRACQELNIESILLHSEVDMQTRAYRLADHRICIGPAPISESYLNIAAQIQGAMASGADAIHPGFGFLSENADFADACEKNGIIFVGPSGKCIRELGDKIYLKKIAQQLKISMVPSYQGEDQSLPQLLQEAEKIGYPVIAKAAAGGGGRGMKLLHSKDEAAELLQSAKTEAQSAFGSSRIFLEKYLDHAKHIEFQIFADSTGKVHHFGDRECSIQRRHQKIIEEALSPSLSIELRKKMSETAVALVQSSGYRGAGTVEFLLQDGKFYLMEMNTRLQVEHPVTENVMGIDLVKAQILTAQNDFILQDSQIRLPQGHSIECRIYAENPYQEGLPSIGRLGKIVFPDGPGRRFEYGFEEGDTITSYYDSMIAKIIVTDENRASAIKRMVETLKGSIIFGVHTNIPYLIEILNHNEFTSGKMTTRFIESYFPKGLPPQKVSEDEKIILAKVAQLVGAAANQQTTSTIASPWHSAWRQFPEHL